MNNENMLSSPDRGVKHSGRSYVAYVTTLDGAEHAVEVASTDDLHTLEGRVKAALGIDLCAELQAVVKPKPLQYTRLGPRTPGEGACDYGDYYYGVTADGRACSSIQGWQDAAVVEPYTLNVLEESESEDGATSYTTTHELYYQDKCIRSKSTTKHRGMSGMFGSEHTVMLKAEDTRVVLTCSVSPARGGVGTNEIWTLVDGHMM